MSMSALQENAWRTANTGSMAFSSLSLGRFIVGLIAVVAMLWFCWVVLGAFRAAARPGGSWGDVPVQVGRALIMLIVILAVVTFS